MESLLEITLENYVVSYLNDENPEALKTLYPFLQEKIIILVQLRKDLSNSEKCAKHFAEHFNTVKSETGRSYDKELIQKIIIEKCIPSTSYCKRHDSYFTHHRCTD